MKTLLALALMFHSACFAQWTPEQKTLAAIYGAAWVVDWKQTTEMTRRTATHHEMNPLLSRYPSRQEVNRYFLVMPIVTFLVLDNIKSEHRTLALSVLTAMEVGLVAHNYSVGMRVQF